MRSISLSPASVLTAIALFLLLASVPATAQELSIEAAGSKGVVVGTGDSGSLEVVLERFDTNDRQYDEVQTLSKEVTAGEYFLPFDKPEQEGSYRVTARLGGEEVRDSFSYLTRTLPKISTAEYNADSSGGSLFVSPVTGEAPVLDACFLLVDGSGRVVESATSNDNPVAKATTLTSAWGLPLEPGRSYSSAVYYSYGSSESLKTASFTAEGDAAIASVSADESSASVEVSGDSQVPFDGEVRVELKRDGSSVEELSKSVGPLFGGEAETLNFFWSDVLEPGSYTLETSLVVDGEVIETETEGLTAKQESSITDVFGDGGGATVTVQGESEIPLEGEVQLTLKQGGGVVETRTVPAPLVLKDNEESVEAAWGERLPKGEYVLNAELVVGGEVMDRSGTVFTVQELPSTPTPTPSSGGVPGPGPAVILLSSVAALYFVRK